MEHDERRRILARRRRDAEERGGYTYYHREQVRDLLRYYRQWLIDESNPHAYTQQVFDELATLTSFANQLEAQLDQIIFLLGAHASRMQLAINLIPNPNLNPHLNQETIAP